ncbi:MAG: GGDEF domain-containing protein [Phycisphaerales bacterium]
MTPRGGAAPPADALRVVLLGQTGLDQSLRREPSLELYRARNTFEAVGELGTPIGPDSPGPAVVIVAAGTVTQDEMMALTSALRRVEPGVCVVGLLDSAQARGIAPEPARYGLDAWLVPPVSAGVLRLLVNNRDVVGGRDVVAGQVESAPVESAPSAGEAAPSVMHTVPIAPPFASAARVEPEDVLVASPSPATAVPVSTMVMRPLPVPDAAGVARGPAHSAAAPPVAVASDLGPVNALLMGSDVVTACLAVLRSRAGGRLSECAFIPAGNAAAAQAGAGVPVVHKGHTFGVLNDASGRNAASDAELREAAAFLASWLALREQQSQLRRAAFTDPLTGAWNRRYFDGFLARAMNDARTSRHDVSLLLFDIDDFKRYNDRFGHGAGDEILVGVVGLLRSVVRASDRVCRLGGDEFAVVFHEPGGPREPGSHHPASILALARRFQKQLAQARFRKLGDDARANLGLSGGLATYPWDGHDAQSLIEHADRLLCESKAKGKNVIRLGPGVSETLSPDDTTPR